MSNLQEKTDEELLAIISSGDKTAMDVLLERYKPVVRKQAKMLYLIGGEREDLLQEGMIGLWHAIWDYKQEKNVRFVNFAKVCISNQMYKAIEASNRKKNIPLNDYVSFENAKESMNAGDFGDNSDFLLWASSQWNPEDLVIDQENEKGLEQYLSGVLSRLEMDVLKAYLVDQDYDYVAQRIGKSPKAVDNALQRIRKKLSENRK